MPGLEDPIALCLRLPTAPPETAPEAGRLGGCCCTWEFQEHSALGPGMARIEDPSQATLGLALPASSSPCT